MFIAFVLVKSQHFWQIYAKLKILNTQQNNNNK